MRAALALAVCAGLLWADGVRAQEPCPLDPPGLISLNYPNADITDVIAAIAAATKKNFLYDDRVRGTVTVLSTECISAEEAYRVFESILQVKGFTTVQGPGGILKIIPVRDAKESPIETLPESERVPNRDLYITRLIPLRFIKADAIANALRPLVSKDANMVEYLPTNTIILTDSAANVRRLLTIIDQIDVETYQEQIKVIPIEFADAGTLAEQLSEIFGGQVTGAGGAPRPVQRARRATPVAQVPAAGDSGALGEQGQPRFITDDRTNSLIVIAPGATIARVERTIALLDYKRRGSGKIHVYRLQNADSEEMAATLAALAGSGGGGGGGIQRTSTTGALGGAVPGAGVGGAVASFEDGAKITADAPTNSLIIQASAEGYSTIKEVIEALDTRRPQVMVEALIMEVDVTDSTDLGSAWLYTAVNGGRGSNRTGEDGITGIGSGQGAASLPNLSDPTALGLAGLANDFTAAILGKTITVDPDGAGPLTARTIPVIQAVLTAAAFNSDLNIISAPVVLTADNKEAQIVIGQEIPVPTSKLQTPTTTTTGQNQSQFTTSSNIERQNVGVTLRVTPQISEGDSVRLEIFQEISDVVAGTAISDLGPTTTKRTIDNTVYVSDGEAVMVGGIVSEALDKSESKVPWLGDIPILGWAFKSTSHSTRKVNLVVILTPRIVRNPGDLQRLTVENREEFRSAAGARIEFTGKEQEARDKALRAGLDLPLDPNPVRRELDKHDKRYPVEQLPSLREEQTKLETERQQHLKDLEAAEAAGEWVVQVSFFRAPDDAAALLNRLIKKGYDGSVLSRVEQAESVHYVQLGPYSTLEKAQQIAREVGADTGLATTVQVGP